MSDPRIEFFWIQETRTGNLGKTIHIHGSLNVKQWQKQMGIGEEE